MKKLLSILLALLLTFGIFDPAFASWMYIKTGTTSQIIQVPIYDSSSTTGAMLTGVVWSSSGLTGYYNRAGVSGATAITWTASTQGTWKSSGWTAIDGTNMPGWYEVGIPDAALATNATSVALHIKGVTNMVPVTVFIQLVANDGTNVNVTQWNGTNVSAPATAGIPEVNVKNINNVATTSVTAVNANQGTTQPINFTGTGATAYAKSDTIFWSGTAVSTPSTAGIPEVNIKNIANAAVSTSTAQLGVNTVNIGGTAAASATIGTVTTATTATNLTNAPTNGDFTSTMKTSLATAVWTTAGTRTLTAGTNIALAKGTGVTGFNDITAASVWTVAARDLTDKAGFALADSTSDAVIADAVWNGATATYGSAGTYGLLLETDLDAAISSRSTLVASDNIGINWADITNPTTAVALTGTTWSTGQAIASVSGAVGSVTGAVTQTQASADLVWSSTANNRLLTAGTNIVLAKGTGVTGFNDITAASVWTSATRTLTAGDNIALAKGTGVTGFNDITAASVWTVATRALTDKANFTLDSGEYTNIGNYVWTTAGVRSLTDKANFTLASGEYANISNANWTTAGTRTITGGTITTNSDKTGYSLSTAGIQAIWDALTSALTTLNSIGKLLVDNINATISSRSTYAGGAVASVTAGVTVTTNNDKTGYRLSATGIDDIWDEVQTLHTTALSFGKYLDAQVSTIGGGSLTVASIADGVWDELTADHTTLGSFSELLNGKKDSNGAYSDLETMIRTSR